MTECLQKILNKNTYNHKLQGEILQTMGILHRKRGDFFQSLTLLREGLRFFRQMEDPFGEGKSLGNIAVTYMEQGNYEEAIQILNERLELASSVKDLHGKMCAFLNLGSVYTYVGDYENALKNQRECLKISKTRDLKRIVAISCANIASTLVQLKRASEGLKYIEEALEILRLIPDLVGECYALGILGDIYEDQGKQESAFHSYRQAWEIACERNDFLVQKRIANRLQKYLTNLLFFRPQLTQKDCETSLSEIIKIAFMADDYDSAIKFNLLLQSNVLFEQSKIHQRKGDFASAIDYCNKALFISADFYAMPLFLDYQKFKAELISDKDDF
jgi:tetratricopeptide (TPR) repeat protein